MKDAFARIEVQVEPPKNDDPISDYVRRHAKAVVKETNRHDAEYSRNVNTYTGGL